MLHRTQEYFRTASIIGGRELGCPFSDLVVFDSSCRYKKKWSKNTLSAKGYISFLFVFLLICVGGGDLEMGWAENLDQQTVQLSSVFYPDVEGTEKSSIVSGKSYSRTNSDLFTFHRWLRSRPNNISSSEQIESIPPAELDPLLAEFFRTVKNRRGLDYDHKSLKYIRASLERHLKAKNYPASITRSPSFQVSQRAYKERKNQLRFAHLSAIVE